jgi:hypothetical protein
MKTLKTLLEMARRNPDQNPKFPAYKRIIELGYTTDEYFFSYTQLKKVGINPSSGYDTPNGVYCFPAKEILKKTHGKMSNVPHVGDIKYIYVLKKTSEGIVDPLESYSKSSFKKDMKKIESIIKRKSSKNTKKYLSILDDLIEMGIRTAKFNTPVAHLWNVTREISADNEFAAFMGWGGVKSRLAVDRYSDADKFDYDKKGRKIRIPRNKRKGIKYNKEGVSYNAQGWNNLLRSLGYNGFVDRTGTGLIHKNEPTQAVFLSPKGYKVVDMIENKSYEKIQTNSRLELLKEALIKDANAITISGTMKDSQLDTFSNFVGAIEGSSIAFHEDNFYINGGRVNGEISGWDVNYENVVFNGGRIMFTKSITNCDIRGGDFNNCKIRNCDISNGEFLSCDIKGIGVLNNGTIEDCKVGEVGLFYNCFISDTKLVDVGFAGNCELSDCKIVGVKSSIVIDQGMKFSNCGLVNFNVNDGLYKDCDFSDSIFRDGMIKGGMISDSTIKGGEFHNVKLYKTDEGGGDFYA